MQRFNLPLGQTLSFTAFHSTLLRRHNLSKPLAFASALMLLSLSVSGLVAQSDPVPLPTPVVSAGFGAQSPEQLPAGSTDVTVETSPDTIDMGQSAATTGKSGKLVYKDATLIADDSFDNTTMLGLPGVTADVSGRGCASSPTRLAWFYKPPGSSSLTSVINNYDIFTFTKNDEKSMRTVQNAGVRPVLQYIKYDAIQDPCFQARKPKGSPCSCSKKPLNNQVAWNAIDICDIRDNHPDWFLRDANGNLLYKDNQVMMDPGSQGWREFWVSRMRSSQSDGWDGILIDNIATTFGMHGTNFVKLQRYSTDSAYQNAVVGFLSYARSTYFKPNNKVMYANISVRWKTDDAYRRFMEQLDGAQDEFWAYSRSGYYSTLSWEDDFFRARDTLSRGDSIILISQGSKTDTKRQLFGFASYLLIASDKTFFRYTSDSGGYGQMWLYDNYLFKLGTPTGAAYKSGDSWKRSFSNGEVKVTPGSREAKITLKSATGC
jgi:hypothetical protein